MRFVNDHLVALSGLLLVVLVVAGVTVVVVRGVGLYRAARRAQGRMAEHVAALTAEAERAQRGADRLAEGQEELQRRLESLSARLALAKILAGHAGRALAVLRAPLRYLGR